MGKLLARKVALLQSKRLYSTEIPVHELEWADFRIGIGRLFDRTEAIPTLTTPREFRFTKDSVYGALTAGSRQVEIIEAYEHSRKIPVFYNLYHPPKIPYRGSVPPPTLRLLKSAPALGCRVMRRQDVHAAMAKLVDGETPTFSQLVVAAPSNSADAFLSHGWRLENFVADELLRCREGRLFEDAQDEILSSLLYARGRPIASAILVTIDLPKGD